MKKVSKKGGSKLENISKEQRQELIQKIVIEAELRENIMSRRSKDISQQCSRTERNRMEGKGEKTEQK